MVSTHLKNISQIGSFPQVGMKIRNIWNHHLLKISFHDFTWLDNQDSPTPKRPRFRQLGRYIEDIYCCPFLPQGKATSAGILLIQETQFVILVKSRGNICQMPSIHLPFLTSQKIMSNASNTALCDYDRGLDIGWRTPAIYYWLKMKKTTLILWDHR